MATWLLFGKLIGVATLFDFGEKRCRKNDPLADLKKEMMDNPYESVSVTINGDECYVGRGRLIVLCVIGFVVTFSLLTIFLFNVMSGSQKLPAQLVRFMLTIGLSACLYRGQSWARYLMVILFGFAAIMSMFALPTIITKAHPVMIVYFVVMIGGYAGSAISLVVFPSVGMFMIHQRSRPS